MALVPIPLPRLDFDPTEVAARGRTRTQCGHRMRSATGAGLGPWRPVPGFGHLPLHGRLATALHWRQAHTALARALAPDEKVLDVPPAPPDHAVKTLGLWRDRPEAPRPAWRVRDGRAAARRQACAS